MNRAAIKPWRSALLLLTALVALSVIAIEPPPKKDALTTGPGAAFETADGDPIASDQAGPEAGGDSGGTGPGGTGPGGSGSQTPGAAGGPGKAGSGTKFECAAGRNGGNTARGVSAGRIKLAATNVRSGTGSSFLGSSYVGMQAVVNRVNAKGGICGRLLDLRLVDDGWDGPRGSGYLATFAKEDYFALPVVPSSEGLTTAIRNGTISRAGIPVVGTDGMLKEQYSDPWVWPVATSTVTTMRVMAKHAYDTGARTFGIVYDQRYKFGLEGASAFRSFVATLSGAQLLSDVPLTPGQPNYSTDAKKFNEKCNPCDFVAMLLTPETAATYISSQSDKDGKRQGFGSKLTGGAQPLFNERFARDCGRPCDGMYVWTGYNPPIGALSSLKDVAAYVDDVQSVDPAADVSNQFLEGAYLGMKVFVAALEKVGPNLTREGLRDALNSLTVKTDLSSPLTWGANQRFANQASQSFKIVTSSGSFAGFAESGTGFLKDPTPGVVPKDS